MTWKWTFSSITPGLWNVFLSAIRETSFISCFKHLAKIHRFAQTFSDPKYEALLLPNLRYYLLLFLTDKVFWYSPTHPPQNHYKALTSSPVEPWARALLLQVEDTPHICCRSHFGGEDNNHNLSYYNYCKALERIAMIMGVECQIPAHWSSCLGMCRHLSMRNDCLKHTHFSLSSDSIF